MCSSECACDCVSFFLLLRVFNFFFFIAVVDTSHTHNFLSFLVMKSSFKKCFLGRGVGVAFRKRKLCTEWDRIKYRVNQKKKKTGSVSRSRLSEGTNRVGQRLWFPVCFSRIFPSCDALPEKVPRFPLLRIPIFLSVHLYPVARSEAVRLRGCLDWFFLLLLLLFSLFLNFGRIASRCCR